MRTLTSYPRWDRRKIMRRSEQGQSFLEFALIVPVLFLMLIGVTAGLTHYSCVQTIALQEEQLVVKVEVKKGQIHYGNQTCDSVITGIFRGSAGSANRSVQGT